jgi:phosphomevalonate kinase
VLTEIPGFALSGKAGAGKSTFARVIANELAMLGNRPSCLFAFAIPLKNEVYKRTGLKKGDPGSRDEMIALGKKLRAEDPEYFIKKMSDLYATVREAGLCPIIDDVRYANELEWCKAQGMYTIRVESTSSERFRRLAQVGYETSIVDSDHESECQLDSLVPHGFDSVLLNETFQVCLNCAARQAIVGATSKWAAAHSGDEAKKGDSL